MSTLNEKKSKPLRTQISDFCKQLYMKLGIHTAPEGTLLYSLNEAIWRVGKLSSEPKAIIHLPSWIKVYRHEILTTSFEEVKETSFLVLLDKEDIITFDIEEGLKQSGAKGIALVFFMGIGDYIFTTPFLAALRIKFPHVPIHAYVSRNRDINNAPLVGELLKYNPNIDAVFYYEGNRSVYSINDWRNYDYKDVYKVVPREFLVLPVFYDYSITTRHRLFSLFRTFSLPKPEGLLRPLLHTPPQISSACDAFLKKVLETYKGGNSKGIIFLHLDARSTQYTYPYADELARKILERGYLVVSATPLSYQNPSCFVIDTNVMSIGDSFMFLKILNQEVPEHFYMITITSVFGSVSSALNITNVQMWHIYDEVAHTMWYPNIHIIAAKDYPAIPEDHIIVADAKNYKINEKHQFDYDASFVIETAFKIFDH